MQIAFDLADGQERETTFRLGAGRSIAEVHDLIFRFRPADARRVALAAGREVWNHTLGAIHADTPDPAVNTMSTGWLSYQTPGCRLWRRSGCYKPRCAYAC